MAFAFIAFVVYAAWQAPEPDNAKLENSPEEEQANGSKKPDLWLESVECKVECQLAVQDRLKSPSTASFTSSSMWETRAEPPQTKVGSRWWVFGEVDAQNSFGTPIRTRFGCELRVVSSEPFEVKVTKVEMD